MYFSRTVNLVTLANVIAEGARQVEGADVGVYRVRDPVDGDDASKYEDGALDAPIITPEIILDSDCVIIGSPASQNFACKELVRFLETLSDFQTSGCLLKGKVAGAFQAVSGYVCGYGGHELSLHQLHGWFLQHGMLPVGVPPSPVMEDAPLASPYGTCMAGKSRADATGNKLKALSETEVKLAYSQGEWAAIITKQLHDDGD